jgi:hypothetical protein
MTKRKGTEGKETQWPNEKDRRTRNTMAKRKGTEGEATQCFCYFLLVIVLLVLSFSLGHCVACPSVSFF